MTGSEKREDPTYEESFLERLIKDFGDLHEQLRALLQRLRDGDASAPKDVQTATALILRSLQTLNEAEMKLADERRKRRGAVGDAAVDFDKARAEIADKIVNLARTKKAKAVPRQPEP